MSRQAVLGALVVALVVAIYLLTVAVGSGQDDGVPEDAGTLESLGNLLRSLPGLGSDLDADDVDARDGFRSCFSDDTFTLDESSSRCVVDVPDGIDRVHLRGLVVEIPDDEPDLTGVCRITVSQPAVFDDQVDVDPRDADVTISLAGDGATLTLTNGPCAIAINPP